MDIDNYSPPSDQLRQLKILLAIVSKCKKVNLDIWILGGYGLDALYGKLTRNHGDFDVFIKEESREEFTNIIQDIGFYKTPKIVGKVKKNVFRNRFLSTNFRLELGTIEQAQKLLNNGNISELLPNQALGLLSEVPILTLSLEVYKKYIEINNQLASQVNGNDYPYREWQKEILKAIEKIYAK